MGMEIERDIYVQVDGEQQKEGERERPRPYHHSIFIPDLPSICNRSELILLMWQTLFASAMKEDISENLEFTLKNSRIKKK